MQRFLPGIAGLFLLLVSAPSSQAQLIDIRPGYVRVPFVRVYSYPGGGSYVRAPFVRSYTPGYGYVGPSNPHEMAYGAGATVYGADRHVPDAKTYVPPRAALEPEQIARMDGPELQQALRGGVEDLKRQLSQFTTGDGWQSYLQTGRLAELAGSDSSARPDAATQQELAAIRGAFSATRSDPSFRMIAGLGGFRTVDAVIAEMTAPEGDRTKQQLLSHASELQEALTRVGRESAWKGNLELPAAVANQGVVPAGGAAASSLREQLEVTLAHYDAMSQNPDARAITDLPAFRATHNSLTAYMSALSGAPEVIPATATEPVPATRPAPAIAPAPRKVETPPATPPAPSQLPAPAGSPSPKPGAVPVPGPE